MVAVITKETLLQEARAFLDELSSQPMTEGSLEWYLSNNLRDYVESVERSDSAKAIKNATRILSRFCTESMNWDTILYRRCTEITEAGFKLAKS